MGEKQTKLSKMQKAILKQLNEKKYYHVRKISHAIAEEFNKDGNKIWDRAQVKKKRMEEIEEAKKAGNEEEYKRLAEGNIYLFRLIDACHKQDKLIKNVCSAAISRALTRLEKRGLIYRVNSFKLHKFKIDQDFENHLKAYPMINDIMDCDGAKIIGVPTFGGRTNYVKLTEEGAKVAKGLQ